MTSILCYIFSSLSLVCALMVITSVNPVHSILFLILVFCNISGLLFILGAEFIAIMFIIVYVGAIAVLFLFVVMMLNIQTYSWNSNFWTVKFFSVFLISIFLFTFLTLLNIDLSSFSDLSLYFNYIDLIWVNWFSYTYKSTHIKAIGSVLYTTYDFVFELCGIVLLVAMINAILLTLHQRLDSKKQIIDLQMSKSSVLVVRFVSLR